MELTLKKKKTGKKGPGHGFVPGTYWDIYKEDGKKPIGFVGYAVGGDSVKQVIVYVNPKYRGEGIATLAEDLLAERLGLRFWDAVISMDNTASRKAHEKAGWRRVAEVYTKEYYPETAGTSTD